MAESCETPCDIDNGSLTELILLLILPSIFGILLIYLSNKIFNFWGDRGMLYYRAKMLMFSSLVLILWFGAMSWGVY